MSWPASLRNLTFDDDFNQSLDNVSFPVGLGLQSLCFGGDFDQSLDNMSWPAGLQTLLLDLTLIRAWTM